MARKIGPVTAVLALSLFLRGAAPAEESTTRPATATERSYQIFAIEGWTVHVNDVLLSTQREPTEKALKLLQRQLQEIVKVVPAPGVAHLRKVPLWFSPEYRGVPPRAEYHPEVGWLRRMGRNPAMAKCVEFTNVPIFEQETDRMPAFVLHELAHAYHDQVIGFDDPAILAAYERAKASKTYDKVERWNGTGKPITHEIAYAMTNEREFFAESTEAFFVRNDFFPFDRAELHEYDPQTEELLKRVWGVAP